jgi:cellulose synthase (UDP-forming)
MACLWWLISRQTLRFEVTPKGGSNERRRSRAPRILWALTGIVSAVVAYATAGTLGWVPWRTDTGSTVASGVWLTLAGLVLLLGTRRIRAAEYATSRRNAHRVEVRTAITVDGVAGELVDVSVGGAAVRFHAGSLPEVGLVEFQLPGAPTIKMEMVRMRHSSTEFELASLGVVANDWDAYRASSLWMFHTPSGAVPGLAPGIPVVAMTQAA